MRTCIFALTATRNCCTGALFFMLTGGCGAAPSSPPAKAPESGGVAASSKASSSATEPAAPSTSATTTVDLPPGGDSQGAKLAEKSTRVEVNPPTSGATPGGGSEPGRSAKDIQTLVVSHRDEARACYDNAVKTHPGIEGNIDIQWTIDPSGSVAMGSVDPARSEITEPSLGACLTSVIKQLRFRASAKGLETHAHYPFNFHPHMHPIRAQGQ